MAPSESDSRPESAGPAAAPSLRGETFYRAQARHRRVAAALSLLTLAGLAMMSAPIASLLFPAVLAVAAAFSNLLSPFFPTPDLGAALAASWERIFSPRNWREVAASLALFLTPGLFAMAYFYARARRIFRRNEGADFLTWLGARKPNLGDPEERQLASLIEEMSIAAGARAPDLYLTEGAGVNCGAFALGGNGRAFVVMSRALLDQFDRAETAALAGQCVAQGAIGDHASGVRLAAALIAIDMSGALLAAPFSPVMRARAAKFLFERNGLSLDDLLAAPAVDAAAAPEEGWRIYAALPFTLAHATFHLVRLLAGLLFFSPALGFLLRRRRFLIDAKGIELSREPDALVRALVHLSAPGGDWVAAADFPGNFALSSRAESALAQAMSSLVRPHPPLAERIARLERLGAVRMTTGPARARPPVVATLLYPVLAALAATLVPLMIFVMSALTMLSFGLGMLAAFAISSATGLVRP